MRIGEAASLLCQIGLLDVPRSLSSGSKDSGRKMSSLSGWKCSGWKGSGSVSGSKGTGRNTSLSQVPQSSALRFESIGPSRLIPFS